MKRREIIAIVVLTTLAITVLVLAILAINQKEAIHQKNVFINETLAELETETLRAEMLNVTVAARDTLVIQLEQDISSKQKHISQQEIELQEIEDIAQQQEEEIKHLREVQASLQEEGKIIVDQWEATLVLYDNVDIYEKQAPFMEIVKDNPISYNKLGIPFIYFRDESRKTVENGVILGSYSTLYNYIYIYKDNTEIRTIYHEIAHIIYQKVFIPNPNNLQAWKALYSDVKNANLLSTNYSATNEIEGFAEEYSVYKIKVKEQPQAIIDFFRQVDEVID
ncbi:MAG: hypothetical protein AABX86_02565 [Nanoarchaeota archaeon]